MAHSRLGLDPRQFKNFKFLFGTLIRREGGEEPQYLVDVKSARLLVTFADGLGSILRNCSHEAERNPFLT